MGAEVKLNSPNSDLWTLISDDIHGGGCSVQVTKIAAHRSIASACSPLEEWGFVHNGFADRAAASANQARGAEFWDILARHSQACLTVDHWNAMIQTVCSRLADGCFMLAVRRQFRLSHFPPGTELGWLTARAYLSRWSYTLVWGIRGSQDCSVVLDCYF